MGDFTQDDRNIRIETPLGKDVLLLAQFDAHEEVSALFRYELQLFSHTPDIKFEDIVGKPVTVTVLSGDEKRYFHGIVQRFRQLETTLELRLNNMCIQKAK
jgi:type VI secretion system secreted protein VgrG